MIKEVPGQSALGIASRVARLSSLSILVALSSHLSPLRLGAYLGFVKVEHAVIANIYPVSCTAMLVRLRRNLIGSPITCLIPPFVTTFLGEANAPSPRKKGWGAERVTKGASFSGWKGRTRTVCQLVSRYTHVRWQRSQIDLTCDLYGVGIHDEQGPSGALHGLSSRPSHRLHLSCYLHLSTSPRTAVQRNIFDSEEGL